MSSAQSLRLWVFAGIMTGAVSTSCARPAAAPQAERPAPVSRDNPCASFASDISSADLAHRNGKIDLATRILHHAAETCPAQTDDTLPLLAISLAELHRDAEARAVIARIRQRSNGAPGTAGAAAQAEHALSIPAASFEQLVDSRRFDEAAEALVRNGWGAPIADRWPGVDELSLPEWSRGEVTSGGVAWSNDGRWLAVLYYDGTLRVFGGQPFELRYFLPLSVRERQYGVPVFSPDSRLLAAQDIDQLHIWAVDTAEEVGRVEEPCHNCEGGYEFSPDSKHIVLEPRWGTRAAARVWTLGAPVQDLGMGEGSGIAGGHRLAGGQFSPRSDAAVSADDRRLFLWRLGSSEPALRLETSMGYTRRFTSDGRWLIVPVPARATRDSSRRALAVIDVASARVSTTLDDSACSADAFAVHPSGATLVTEAASGAICVWDLAQHRVVHRVKSTEKSSPERRPSQRLRYYADGAWLVEQRPSTREHSIDNHLRVFRTSDWTVAGEYDPCAEANGGFFCGDGNDRAVIELPASGLVTRHMNAQFSPRVISTAGVIGEGDRLAMFYDWSAGSLKTIGPAYSLFPAPGFALLATTHAGRLSVAELPSLRPILRGGTSAGALERVAVSADGRSMVTLQQSKVRAWDTRNLTVQASAVPPDRQCVLSSLGRVECTTSWGAGPKRSPLEGWAGLGQPCIGLPADGSPDGRFRVGQEYMGATFVEDTTSKRKVMISNASGAPEAWSFTLDGALAAVARARADDSEGEGDEALTLTADSGVALLDSKAWKIKAQLPTSEPVVTVAFGTSDTTLLAVSAGQSGQLYLWHLNRMGEPPHVARAGAVSQDRPQLLAGPRNSGVSVLWDHSLSVIDERRGEIISTYSALGISSVAFLSPRTLAVAVADELRLVRTSDGKLLATMVSSADSEAFVLMGPDGDFDAVGPAGTASSLLACRAGIHPVPFEVCEARHGRPGFLQDVLAGL